MFIARSPNRILIAPQEFDVSLRATKHHAPMELSTLFTREAYKHFAALRRVLIVVFLLTTLFGATNVTVHAQTIFRVCSEPCSF